MVCCMEGIDDCWAEDGRDDDALIVEHNSIDRPERFTELEVLLELVWDTVPAGREPVLNGVE